MVHIGMKVPEDLAAGIKARADAEDRTVSAEIRRALRAHLATTSNAPAAVNGEGVKDAEAAWSMSGSSSRRSGSAAS